jgi:hypothetical protein
VTFGEMSGDSEGGGAKGSKTNVRLGGETSLREPLRVSSGRWTLEDGEYRLQQYGLAAVPVG